MKLPSVSRADLATTSFLALLIVAFATRNALLLAAYALAAFGLVMLNLKQLTRSSVRERDMAVVLALALTAMLPLSTVRNESAIVHYFTVLVSLGAAFVLTRNLEVYLRASRVTLIAAQCSVLVYLFFRGLENFPLEDMLPDSSSNGVTSYLILLQTNYCIVNILLRRRTSMVTSLITLGICVVGYGRGSLLTAAAIVAINAVFSTSFQSRARALLGALLIVGASVGVYVTYSEEINTFVEINTKIGSGLYDEPRERIINDYLNKIDGISLIIGADYRGTSIDEDYNRNPHNSYIRAHHIFGLPYVLLVLLFPVVLLWKGHAPTVKAFCALVFLLILFRSFTEPLLFPTLFDLYYFAICFALGRRVSGPAPTVSNRRR